MRRSFLLAVVAVATAARMSAAQDTTSLVGDHAANAELTKIIEATQRDGLPVEPILTKIRYAAVVRAPTPKIIAAARATAGRLAEARTALAPHPTALDIVAGADALTILSAQTLSAVRKISANRPLAVPLGVLTQLVANGVDETRAAKIVTDFLKKGATATQIAELGNAVGDVALGTKLTNALELRVNHLNAVLALPSASGDAATAAPGLMSGDPRKKP
jgi:hypothetical protein